MTGDELENHVKNVSKYTFRDVLVVVILDHNSIGAKRPDHFFDFYLFLYSVWAVKATKNKMVLIKISIPDIRDRINKLICLMPESELKHMFFISCIGQN